MCRTRSIHFLLPAAAPAITSEWPERYFVALCTTMSNPRSIGRCSSGVANVLSIIEISLYFLANAIALFKSTSRSVGFVGVSTYRTFVLPVTSDSIPSSEVSARRTTMPQSGNSSRISRYVPPYVCAVEITSSPCFSAPSSAAEIAAMPDAVTTAASAPSSAAIFPSAIDSVGFPYRV